MPSGVYPRTENQLRAAAANLAKGREPEAQLKARRSLGKIVKTAEWRLKVSVATKEAMIRPEIRKKHIGALAAARTKHGNNFQGGNGTEPVSTVKSLEPFLNKLGFERELAVKTKGHGTSHKPPDSYKVDFGHGRAKLAIEVDGPAHRGTKQKTLDLKKDDVLHALGWAVLRITHD